MTSIAAAAVIIASVGIWAAAFISFITELNCLFHRKVTNMENMLAEIDKTTGKMRLYIIFFSNCMALPPENHS